MRTKLLFGFAMAILWPAVTNNIVVGKHVGRLQNKVHVTDQHDNPLAEISAVGLLALSHAGKDTLSELKSKDSVRPKPQAPKPSVTKPPATKPSAPKSPAPKPPAPKSPAPKTPKSPAPKSPAPKSPAPKAPTQNRIAAAIRATDATASRYKPRDIDGDGEDNTFCNRYVADVAKALGRSRAIPRYNESYPGRPGELRPKSANHIYDDLAAESRKPNGSWKAASAAEAAAAANRGEFVVASKANPNRRESGHIAVVIPGSKANGIRIAQAGRVTGNDLPLKDGFGSATPDYFVYKEK